MTGSADYYDMNKLSRRMEGLTGATCKIATALAMILVALQNAGVEAQLRVNFYNTTCKEVESIVKSAMEAKFKAAPTSAAGTLRLFFHDCFVNVLIHMIPAPDGPKTCEFHSWSSTRGTSFRYVSNSVKRLSIVILCVAGLRWLGAPGIHR